jgi:acyl dehydratase
MAPVTTIVHGLEGLRALAGTDLGTTDWLQVTQEQVDMFADATGDHQWIHVDVERAKAGPFGSTIAHGYLTLALVIPLFSELLQVTGVTMGLNYGLEKVRFPSPVPVGSRVRMAGNIARADDVPGGGVQVHVTVTIEVENVQKPACIAEAVYRYYA